MKRIVEESSQNVNSNAGIFLAKQILDAIPSFGKFDSCQPSEKSLACQTYSNSSIAKAESGTKRPERIRLRTVILTLMYVAAIDGNHGGRKYLRLGRNCHRAKTFQAVFRRLAA